MKKLLPMLLELVLLVSFVGFSYATTLQPLDKSCNPNSPNYDGAQCGAHSGGGDPHSHGCNAPGQKDPDLCCIANIHVDKPCGPPP